MLLTMCLSNRALTVKSAKATGSLHCCMHRFKRAVCKPALPAVHLKCCFACASAAAAACLHQAFPDGVVCRDADEGNQPQSRYEALSGKADEQWGDKKVTDLYQDANKNANATAESGKTKARENAKAKAS